MMITLEHLLESRDARRQLQQKLLAQHPDRTLLCLTVVMPGNVKRSEQSLKVAAAATDAIRKVFGEINIQRDLETGYEAYILTDLPASEAKAAACRIEDTHPLGRLFDIDVIGTDGRPAGRADFGIAPRKCLVCGDDARVCMRLRRHDYKILLDKIARMIDDYELRV